MPAPSSYNYAVAAIVAAHTSFRDLIDSGSGPGVMKCYTNGDSLLGTITLTDPSGSVDSGTGKLTFVAASIPNASAGGTVAYVTVCNSSGTVYLALPVQAGTSAVSGYAVFNTLTLVSGGPLQLVSATIG